MVRPIPANDTKRYTDGDTYLWCDCGRANYWVVRDRQTNLYHVICSQCEADHTFQIFNSSH